jgi:hypothetical protein
MIGLMAIFFINLVSTLAFAQPTDQKLRVATRIVKPFVFEENRALIRTFPASLRLVGGQPPP